MVSRREVLGSAGIAMSVSVAGCAFFQADGPEGGDSPSDVDSEEIPDGPLEIVLADIFTGPGSVYGEEAEAVVNILVDDINSNGGVLGEKEIEVIDTIDEAEGDVDTVINNIRSAVVENEVDAVWGLVFDHTTRAAVPVLNELDTLLIGGAGGHFNRDNYLLPQSDDFNELFIRPFTLDTVDSGGAALYVAKHLPDTAKVAGVNQDYAWGQDAWDIFSSTIESVAPEIDIGPDIKTEIAPPDFSDYVTRLNEENPDVVFCSAFGPYVMNLLEAGQQQGLWGESYSETVPIFSLGVEMLREFGQQDILEGTLMTSRGANISNLFYNENDEHAMFVDALREEGIDYPSHNSYHYYRVIKTHVAAIETFYNLTGTYPSNQEIAKFTRGNQIFTLPGYPLPLPNNQGYAPGMVGEVVNPSGLDTPVVSNYELIPAYLCNPYPGMSTQDWISDGMIADGWTSFEENPFN
jgi:branched-chain amino acid transport system substrate-binding protein